MSEQAVGADFFVCYYFPLRISNNTEAGFRFRSSSPPRVYVDYYFHVDRLFGYVGADAHVREERGKTGS
jgi:hypothetical protein